MLNIPQNFTEYQEEENEEEMIDPDDLDIIEDDRNINYEPTKQDLKTHAEELGIDISKYPEAVNFVYYALKTPLPENWKKAVIRDTREILYINLIDQTLHNLSPYDEEAQLKYKQLSEKKKPAEAKPKNLPPLGGEQTKKPKNKDKELDFLYQQDINKIKEEISQTLSSKDRDITPEAFHTKKINFEEEMTSKIEQTSNSKKETSKPPTENTLTSNSSKNKDAVVVNYNNSPNTNQPHTNQNSKQNNNNNQIHQAPQHQNQNSFLQKNIKEAKENVTPIIVKQTPSNNLSTLNQQSYEDKQTKNQNSRNSSIPQDQLLHQITSQESQINYKNQSQSLPYSHQSQGYDQNNNRSSPLPENARSKSPLFNKKTNKKDSLITRKNQYQDQMIQELEQYKNLYIMKKEDAEKQQKEKTLRKVEQLRKGFEFAEKNHLNMSELKFEEFKDNLIQEKNNAFNKVQYQNLMIKTQNEEKDVLNTINQLNNKIATLEEEKSKLTKENSDFINRKNREASSNQMNLQKALVEYQSFFEDKRKIDKKNSFSKYEDEYKQYEKQCQEEYSKDELKLQEEYSNKTKAETTNKFSQVTKLLEAYEESINESTSFEKKQIEEEIKKLYDQKLYKFKVDIEKEVQIKKDLYNQELQAIQTKKIELNLMEEIIDEEEAIEENVEIDKTSNSIKELINNRSRQQKVSSYSKSIVPSKYKCFINSIETYLKDRLSKIINSIDSLKSNLTNGYEDIFVFINKILIPQERIENEQENEGDEQNKIGVAVESIYNLSGSIFSTNEEMFFRFRKCELHLFEKDYEIKQLFLKQDKVSDILNVIITVFSKYFSREEGSSQEFYNEVYKDIVKYLLEKNLISFNLEKKQDKQKNEITVFHEINEISPSILLNILQMHILKEQENKKNNFYNQYNHCLSLDFNKDKKEFSSTSLLLNSSNIQNKKLKAEVTKIDSNSKDFNHLSSNQNIYVQNQQKFEVKKEELLNLKDEQKSSLEFVIRFLTKEKSLLENSIEENKKEQARLNNMNKDFIQQSLKNNSIYGSNFRFNTNPLFSTLDVMESNIKKLKIREIDLLTMRNELNVIEEEAALFFEGFLYKKNEFTQDLYDRILETKISSLEKKIQKYNLNNTLYSGVSSQESKLHENNYQMNNSVGLNFNETKPLNHISVSLPQNSRNKQTFTENKSTFGSLVQFDSVIGQTKDNKFFKENNTFYDKNFYAGPSLGNISSLLRENSFVGDYEAFKTKMKYSSVIKEKDKQVYNVSNNSYFRDKYKKYY